MNELHLFTLQVLSQCFAQDQIILYSCVRSWSRYNLNTTSIVLQCELSMALKWTACPEEDVTSRCVCRSMDTTHECVVVVVQSELIIDLLFDTIVLPNVYICHFLHTPVQNCHSKTEAIYGKQKRTPMFIPSCLYSNDLTTAHYRLLWSLSITGQDKNKQTK